MRAINQATREATVEIQQLIADYWCDVDTDKSRTAPEFFIEDCVFEPGTGVTYNGRAGIRAFYDNRAKRGERTTRHAAHNIRVHLESPSRAVVDYIVVLYGADRPPPVIDSAGPSVVMDVAAVCERDETGRWRFASLRGSAAFIGHEPYTRASLTKA